MRPGIRLVIVWRLDGDPVVYIDERIEQNPVDLGVYAPNLTARLSETVRVLDRVGSCRDE